ncbi:MAG: hypothetical protein N2508_05540, partial [Anaerolineae bacterium]|nr:hypothetical protein [Anaerolineae bacterium]
MSDAMRVGVRTGGGLLVCAILLIPLLMPAPVAALPAGFQEYYVLGYEEHIYNMFERVDLSLIHISEPT